MIEEFGIFLQPYDRTIGLFGVGVYIGSYFLVQAGFIKGRGYIYPTLNLWAAFLVALTTVNEFNLASLVIQLSWIAISVMGISRLLYHRFSTTFTSDEAAFLNARLPLLSAHCARQFLDAGAWQTMRAGRVLLRQGELAERLTYIADGKARVLLDGRVAYEVDGDEFVGETVCLGADPAPATVQLLTDAHCFSIEAKTLRRMAVRSTELGVALELCLAREIKDKLQQANRRIVTVLTSQIDKDGPRQGRQLAVHLPRPSSQRNAWKHRLMEPAPEPPDAFGELAQVARGARFAAARPAPRPSGARGGERQDRR